MGVRPEGQAGVVSETPREIDLSVDLAECEELIESDLECLALVSSASVACGAHAGSMELLKMLLPRAIEFEVSIGAHVGYFDRDGFGRKELGLRDSEIAAQVAQQIEPVTQLVESLGSSVEFVKPHGALYHRCSENSATADAVLSATGELGVVGWPDGALAQRARQRGRRVALEVFADRGYIDAKLIPRDMPGAILEPAAASSQALDALTNAGVSPGTICCHSDSPGASLTLKAVREALEGAGYLVQSYWR